MTTCMGNCCSPGCRLWCLWWCLFVLSFFPRGVLDEILNLIEPVSEGFPSYSYTSVHFIWKLWNEPSASFINCIWNDHKCRYCLLYDSVKWDLITYKIYTISGKKTHCWHRRWQWRYIYAPKCDYTCGHTIFMTWRYSLNNSDVIW